MPATIMSPSDEATYKVAYLKAFTESDQTLSYASRVGLAHDQAMLTVETKRNQC